MNDNKKWTLVGIWRYCMASVRNRTLFVGFLCGCISVLVDLDHIIQVVFDTGARPFHIYSFITAVIIGVGCCAYLGRLCLKSVLKRDKIVNS
jgi:undecaprenyl pyrophosphate phosphatase UppP